MIRTKRNWESEFLDKRYNEPQCHFTRGFLKDFSRDFSIKSLHQGRRNASVWAMNTVNSYSRLGNRMVIRASEMLLRV